MEHSLTHRLAFVAGHHTITYMVPITGYWSPPPRALPSLPELTYVGSMSARSVEAIGAHRHHGWEICLIERGRTHWFVDGRSLEVRGGHLVVIPPHALHDGWQPGSYRFLGLLLPRTASASLLGLPRPQARQIIAGLHAAVARGPTRGRDTLGAWRRLERAWNSGVRTAAIDARSALLEILAAIADPHEATVGASVIVRQALGEFAAADRLIPLAELAARLHCSESHLKAVFRQETGLPPAEYHRRQRIARAWRDLRTSDRSITDIALAYGFPSSQHFATTFKRITGATPRAARRSSAEQAECIVAG